MDPAPQATQRLLPDVVWEPRGEGIEVKGKGLMQVRVKRRGWLGRRGHSPGLPLPHALKPCGAPSQLWLTVYLSLHVCEYALPSPTDSARLPTPPQTYWWAGDQANVCHRARDRVITRIAGGRIPAARPQGLRPPSAVQLAQPSDEYPELEGYSDGEAAAGKQDDNWGVSLLL